MKVVISVNIAWHAMPIHLLIPSSFLFLRIVHCRPTSLFSCDNISTQNRLCYRHEWNRNISHLKPNTEMERHVAMALRYFSSHGKHPFYPIIYTHLMKFFAVSLIRNPSFDANWTILFSNFHLILHHFLSPLLLYVYLAIPFCNPNDMRCHTISYQKYKFLYEFDKELI